MANLGISPAIMDDDRISKAVGRIEQALALIETQAALTGSGARAAAGGDAELSARHEALRDSVSASLAELDSLIGEIEP